MRCKTAVETTRQEEFVTMYAKHLNEVERKRMHDSVA